MVKRVIIGCWLICMCAMIQLAGAQQRGTTLPPGFENYKNAPINPSTTVSDADGRMISLDDFRNKIVILNVWATWCGPCVAEIPSLERLSAKLLPGKFVVLLLSQDRGGAAIAAPFLKRIGAQPGAALFDPRGKLFRELGLRGLPSTIVIGADGNMLARVEGAIDWDREDVLEYLLALVSS